ncbi:MULTISPECIES: fluoride efflux transporter FluC [Leuconostoc]|uniref:Fluoride-specific ion channel FluC n=1 Tax=Leuconostoc holzapfelii TaxID=434464 RepID=A0A846ZIP5_9LACO|nr:CrcB family protein [Leuconostoc holzapfelii]NKZ18993.1 CrcB family protein [Leuconostoc holzapfelii]
MSILVAIFIGSFLGTLGRYLLITFWPWQTTYLTAVFAVNMLGAFLMGAMFATGTLQLWHGAVATGVLGGLTTFSTMMTQSAQQPRQQIRYLGLQVLCGLLSFGAGSTLAALLK